MTSWNDEPGEVRSLEALPIDVIAGWVRTILPQLQGTPQILQYPGGASNLTYLLRYPEKDLILRRPPLGRKAKGAHDMKREALVLHALRPVFPSVPEVYGLADLEDVGECLLMQRLHGIILRKDLPQGMQMSPDTARQLCHRMLDRLIELHRINPAEAGLGELDKGPGYVRRQIQGWSERYQASCTDDVPDFSGIMAWLAHNQPEDQPHRLIHNDYRFDNLVLDPSHPEQIIGILDWEMATVGDPLMDLGNSLAYWVQADDQGLFRSMRRQPTHLPGMLSRAEVITYYAEKTGLAETGFLFYEVYGLFRLAVIVQQIYERYLKGKAANPLYGQFGAMVQALEVRCLARLEQG